MAETETKTVRVGRYNTLYHRAGVGEERSILFLHGSGPGVSAWANWQYALPALGEHYDCIAPDLQGFGQSEHPSDPPRHMSDWLDLWVEQIIGLLDTQGLQTVDMVGNSMGGAIALHLLHRHPRRFSHTVLMGALGVPFTITSYLDQGWGFYREPSVDLLSKLIRAFVSNPDVIGGDIDQIAAARWKEVQHEESRRSFEAMFADSPQAAVDALALPETVLREIAQPLLVTHGREDNYIPLNNSVSLMQLIPNAQLHVFHHCGHWIQIEKRHAFHALLAAFFAGQLD